MWSPSRTPVEGGALEVIGVVSREVTEGGRYKVHRLLKARGHHEDEPGTKWKEQQLQ